jgi:pimeloyl-ACP methyl ester carboxylesterase
MFNQGDSNMPFYDRGKIRIHYEEVGSGPPLLVIPGGGLNAMIPYVTVNGPFNVFEEFKNEYRVISFDLRNSTGSESTGPLEIDRPWDGYTDDHLGLMDHLGIDKFLVMGFCIGGPFIWNMLRRAPNRVIAAVLAQPSGARPEMPGLFYNNNIKGWAPSLCAARPEIMMEQCERFQKNM